MCVAAATHGVTASTVCKWLGRFLASGETAMFDASSRLLCSPRAIEPNKELAIVELRHRRRTEPRIACHPVRNVSMALLHLYLAQLATQFNQLLAFTGAERARRVRCGATS